MPTLPRYKNNGHTAAIYALSTKGSANYTVCAVTGTQAWMLGAAYCASGAMLMQLTAFDEVATVVEHVASPGLNG